MCVCVCDGMCICDVCVRTPPELDLCIELTVIIECSPQICACMCVCMCIL